MKKNNRLCRFDWLRTIVTALLALAALAGQAKTYKTIKAPVAMACVNVHDGELKAREVIFRDTATTVHFTMEYPKDQRFQFASSSYLLDEEGNRYPLRSAEGIGVDAWVQSPESGVTEFTMHFEPLPKPIQVFDFVGGDRPSAFKLLGIHDRNYQIKAPTLQELSDANPYQVPADWFTTDTITIRGRFEGYDAEKFGFTSMECFYEDVFEKDAATLVLDIAADGTFEKKFLASYPVCDKFYSRETKVGFSEIPFFARPGETIDITVRPDEQGRYACYYHSGSSKEVERWLKSGLSFEDIAFPLPLFKCSFSEVGEEAERTWQNMLYRLQTKGRNSHFTAQEMQLALADLQVNFACAVMDCAMYRKGSVVKNERQDDGYRQVILDSVEWEEMHKMENYWTLHRVDFDNPLLLTCNQCPHTLNRIQFSEPVRRRQYDGILNEDGGYDGNVETGKKILANSISAYRELMGSEGDDLMAAQLCIYKEMTTSFDIWSGIEATVTKILADTTQTLAASMANFQTPGKMMPLYLDALSHPYIHQKAEEFYAYKMAQKDLTTPLPANNASADLIRSLCDKYPGRYLFIDFWGMGCGPCRSAIQMSKNLRAEVAKRDDVKLIFIVGERTAEGSDAYHQYVNEWLADEETVCITNAEFTRLQELFRFNGIPHYETITPDCRRVRDDLRVNGYYNFDYEINRLMEKLK